ncbi:nucleotide exchange factor GrpE [Planococcus lenghuensis]|uniref:Protein GrpE n=1 Tax=Planococcus lenghuensis TaxID=2213202 RepID=A0A1Q2KXW0_9BACL|nr:nucleotide exchange factor GrpE [Planococcus lenghuensis]AQQ52956.1 nucleotide exchange factor GrpE [Planococcus lenghuensis]
MAEQTNQQNEKEQKPADTETATEQETANTETPEPETEEVSGVQAEDAGDLQSEVDRLQEEVENEQNKYLRLLADYENFKRRSVKDREEAEKFRSKALLSDLLPVLDNFERALAAETENENNKSLLKGVRMVYNTLLEAVKREGLEEVKSVGEPFDPNVHQAVMQEKDDSQEPGIVLQEFQKGYILKGRVLRPAMVKVNE